MDEKIVSEWLSKVAFHYRALIKSSRYNGLNLCMSEKEEIQLYGCIRKIIDILGISFREKIIEYEDGSKPNLRISFMYDCMEFFELEELRCRK